VTLLSDGECDTRKASGFGRERPSHIDLRIVDNFLSNDSDARTS
jgi:hypothetical protein